MPTTLCLMRRCAVRALRARLRGISRAEPRPPGLQDTMHLAQSGLCFAQASSWLSPKQRPSLGSCLQTSPGTTPSV